MKKWFLFRFGIIGGLSAITYYIMNFVVPSYFMLRENQIFAYAWLATSMIFLTGFAIIKWQFDNIPSGPKEDFDFQAYLHGEKKGSAPNLSELARRSPGKRNQNPGKPGATEIREVSTEKNPLDMGQIVEGVVGQSLADAELTLDLEVPEGTELDVYGQKYKVKKGSLKIKPRKSKEQKLKEMFPQLKTRRRKA